MKVLFVVPYAPTRIRTRPFHLIRALAGEGHRVSLATIEGLAVGSMKRLEEVGDAVNALISPDQPRREFYSLLP